jgi:phosphoribosyl-ATP pyrophosphohydrolase
MIIPSIDIMNGRAVQLIRGREKAIDAGDPLPILERFALLGEVAVIDLDAAMGAGSNADLVREMVRRAACRVGGGIRDLDTARRWLDEGAARIILGTAARPDLLSQLPRDRTIAALDAEDGEVVVDGWRTRTGARLIDRLDELKGVAGGFLITFVEHEGTMSGLDVSRAAALRERLPSDTRLTVAGGVREAIEVAALDRLNIDAQVGMALYTGRFHATEALAATLVSDRLDNLWSTIVADEHGRALGLCYSDAASLRAAYEERRGVYCSRTRGLWRKGESSGDKQELLRIGVDCDRDALLFTVRQKGRGFCHGGSHTCFGEDRGLARLARRLADRIERSEPGSYTSRLASDPELLAAKLREEAEELIAAHTAGEITDEAADLLYFTLARLAAANIPLADVERELDRRERRLSRRPGDAKTVARPSAARKEGAR